MVGASSARRQISEGLLASDALEDSQGFVHRELRYDTAYALQRRVNGRPHFRVRETLRKWGGPFRGETSFRVLRRLSTSRRVTGHVGRVVGGSGKRSVSPSCESQDSGWSKTLVGSDSRGPGQQRPTLETDELQEFSLILQRQDTSPELRAEYLRKLSSRNFAFLLRASEETFDRSDR